ncbi:DUF3137 domain-containing protein [Haploplasma axanthum]|uniref:Protein of uncharacterized function (DUF3137) n=1 Tax=Haploplasma axanthum TaxID=29552 RepID=A0A449BDW9_HAPAX|nr:DUF3137 domain-containing protein [Haploplasma axanthum]VEU80654.1 Protein of uncharacterised function (DUF3137) [Haploplasma axanthum]
MKLKEIEQKRIEIYKKTKTTIIIGIGLIVGSFLLFVIIAANMAFDRGPLLIIILLTTFFCGAVIAGIGSNQQKKFKNEIKNKLIDLDDFSEIKNLTYDANKHIEEKTIEEVKILQNPDRVRGEDLVTGTYKDIYFEVSDIKLSDRDSDGNEHTYFEGVWYTFKLPQNFNSTIKVMKMHNFSRKIFKVETEMYEFNKRFKQYTDNQNLYFKIMKPIFIEKIIELEDKYKSKISFAYINDYFYLAMEDRKEFLKVDLSNEINEKTIKNFKEDIREILQFIDEFYYNQNGILID